MSEERGFLITLDWLEQYSFKGEERDYPSEAPNRREVQYCVGDIRKEALNSRLKWAESLRPHL
jgi:hypothetical protein